MNPPAAGVPPLNFRDVGGLPTESGAPTRHDVLYRSDTLYSTDELGGLAPAWPPATVVDLRRDRERTTLDVNWPAATRVHRFGLLDPSLTRTSASLAELYVRLLAGSGATVAEIVAIAARSSGSLLVHCAAGKDRTGIVVAVLLRAAGVTREAVVADYLATGGAARRRGERVAAYALPMRQSPVPDEFYDVSREAIEAVLDRVDGAGDGVARWLARQGVSAKDRAAWRARLVDDGGPAGKARAQQ